MFKINKRNAVTDMQCAVMRSLMKMMIGNVMNVYMCMSEIATIFRSESTIRQQPANRPTPAEAALQNAVHK